MPRTALLTLCLIAALPAVADARGLEARDLAALERVSSPTLSPDGRHLVFAQRSIDLDANSGSSALYARNLVARALTDLGGRPVYRSGVVTDNGNHILDVHDLVIEQAVELENHINQITGVVTVGLFARRPADVLLLGTPSGVRRIDRPA